MIVITPSRNGKNLHGLPCIGEVGVIDIVIARNRSLSLALEIDRNEPQLWIDDDIDGVTSKVIAELERVQQISGADIVCGWYTDKLGFPVNKPETGDYPEDWHELIAGATGCMLVMPNVWDRIDAPKGRYGFGYSPAAFNHVMSWDGAQNGEDFSFCSKAKQAGLKVVSANNVCVTHRDLSKPQDENGVYPIKGIQLEPDKVKKDLRDMFREEPISVIEGNVELCQLCLFDDVSRADSEVVLVVNRSVQVDRSVLVERVRKWRTNFGPPWYSEYFGAGILSEDGSVILTTRRVAQMVIRNFDIQESEGLSALVNTVKSTWFGRSKNNTLLVVKTNPILEDSITRMEIVC